MEKDQKEIIKEFCQLFEKQSNQENLNEKGKRKLELTESDKGCVLYISPKSARYRIRIYTGNSLIQNLRTELELRTTILSKATNIWLNNESQNFLLEILVLFKKELNTIVQVPLNKEFKIEGTEFIKKWIDYLKPVNKNQQKASKFNIKAYSPDSNNQEFLLDLHKVYPTYLAVYQTSLAAIRNESNKQNESELIFLSFSIVELLDKIGLPCTDHYKRKIISSLIFLESVTLILETSKSRTCAPLISTSVINKKKLTIDLFLNVRVLKFFHDEKLMDENFYKTSIKDYLTALHNGKFSEKAIPSYLYLLLSKTYASIDKNVLCEEIKLKNITSRKHLVKVICWIFQENYIDRNFITKEDFVTTKTKKKLTFTFENEFFEINLSRERNYKKDNILDISVENLPS